jgi:hypothetical protein
MTHTLAGRNRFARQEAGRVARKAAAMVLVGCYLASWPARAQEENVENAVTPPALAPAVGSPATPAPTAPPPAVPSLTPTPPPPSNPALDVRAPTEQPAQSSVFRRWWFWTAVGAVAAGTVAVIVISSQGHAPPATDLGNQEFQP